MAVRKCPGKCDGLNYILNDEDDLCQTCKADLIVAAKPTRQRRTSSNPINSGTRKIGEIRYFLKPLGYSGTPYTGDGFPLIQNFAREPKSTSVGDILISYSVSNGRLVGYYEVLTEPFKDGEATRWEWCVETKCLSENYTTNWGRKDLYLTSVTNQFLRDNPNELLTNNGGATLGALQFGADRIRLTDDFAKFLIDRINKY